MVTSFGRTSTVADHPCRRTTRFLMKLSAYLREHTRGHHDRIEAVPCMARLLAEDLGFEEYGAALARLYGYYRPLEARVYAAPVPALVTALELRPKHPALAADLGAWGLRRQTLPMAATGDLPRLDSEGARCGALYVLEGATLGGTVLARRLRAVLGARVDGALRFHGFYGEATGAHWRRFRDVLDTHCGADSAGAAEALRGAVEVYDSMTRWLEDAPSIHGATPELTALFQTDTDVFS